jgi:hypothetical protein
MSPLSLLLSASPGRSKQGRRCLRVRRMNKVFLLGLSRGGAGARRNDRRPRPKLEKAIHVVLEKLEKNPLQKPQRPLFEKF